MTTNIGAGVRLDHNQGGARWESLPTPAPLNRSKAGPMRPDTKKRLVDRAALYLEQEAREYRQEAALSHLYEAGVAAKFGRRAARLFAAARTLRNLEF